MTPFTRTTTRGLGTVIATRTLQTEASEVVVRLGAPRPMAAEPRDWECPWRVDGLEDGPVERCAFGIDALQALILALTQIGDQLTHHRLPVTFLGFPELGVPTTNPVVLGSSCATATIRHRVAA